MSLVVQWKKITGDPFVVLTLFSTCAGLLVDFQEATTKVLNTLPVLQAFLPIVILSGTVFFGLHALRYLICIFPGSCYSFVHSRLPGVKWGEKHHAEIRRLVLRVDREYHPSGLLPLTPELFTTLNDFSERMQKYRIQCPPVTRDPKCIDEWLLFLPKLSSYAATHNLKDARTVWEKIEA